MTAPPVLALWLFVLWLFVPWFPGEAFGQAPTSAPPNPAGPDAPAWSAEAHVGLCQCIADHATLRRTCLTSRQECQATCSNVIYSFLPLTRDALSICPPKELYVVLPNADGRPGSGAITVSGATTNTTLDKSYAAAAGLPGGKEPASVAMSSSETEVVFSRAIGARPILPQHFTIHFALGSAVPGPEAATDYQALLKDIKSRSVYEIEVAGYTDTISAQALNQKLSLDRATAIAAAMIRDGVDKRAVAITGYGKQFLAYPTADEVAEARNRRVEVWVR